MRSEGQGRDGLGTRMVRCAALAALAAAVTAAPAAAARPAVSTGEARDVGPQGATVSGSVNPHGRATTYFFQYGADRLYGAATPETPAGNGRGRLAVTAALAGLAPATRYHYRLVARNRDGLTLGRDRTLRTRRQPLALTLAPSVNPVALGAPVTLAGTLTGTNNDGRQVVLQANPFPYAQGFATAANPQVTDAQGRFSFPLLSVPVNTQYRVVLSARPEVASAVVSLGVAVRVTTRVRVLRRARPGHRARVRFSGTVRPAGTGAQIVVQRLRRDGWATVGRTVTRGGGRSFSRYAKRLRVRRNGRFRVVAVLGAAPWVSNDGRSKRVRVRR